MLISSILQHLESSDERSSIHRDTASSSFNKDGSALERKEKGKVTKRCVLHRCLPFDL